MTTTIINYHSLELVVIYNTNGVIGPDACVEELTSVLAGPMDILPVLCEEYREEICRKIERSWK